VLTSLRAVTPLLAEHFPRERKTKRRLAQKGSVLVTGLPVLTNNAGSNAPSSSSAAQRSFQSAAKAQVRRQISALPTPSGTMIPPAMSTAVISFTPHFSALRSARIRSLARNSVCLRAERKTPDCCFTGLDGCFTGLDLCFTGLDRHISSFTGIDFLAALAVMLCFAALAQRARLILDSYHSFLVAGADMLTSGMVLPD